jgi:hypothetical protein
MYFAIPRRALRISAQNGKFSQRNDRAWGHFLTLKDLQGREPGRPW